MADFLDDIMGEPDLGPIKIRPGLVVGVRAKNSAEFDATVPNSLDEVRAMVIEFEDEAEG